MKKNILSSVSLLYTLCLFFIFSSFTGVSAQESWAPTSVGSNVPNARFDHLAVSTGNKMIIWGGAVSNSIDLNTGGVYDPSSDSWTATSTTNAPSARSQSAAVWTGSKMIVWGGRGFLNTGGLYDPAANSWTAVSTTNAPTGRARHTAIWTGTKMIIWGGLSAGGIYVNTGGIYDPSTNSWTATSTVNAPSPRLFHNAIWTGTKMIVWGGRDSSHAFNTGGIYDPQTNSWTATSTTNAPTPRQEGAMIWTGDKMIVWAGYDAIAFTTNNTGGIYNPTTDTWTSITTTNAPSKRVDFATIWSGSNMIIWGGYDVTNVAFNTGGIYDPAANTWTPTLITGAPAPRNIHTGVLISGKFIVWGGCDVNINPFNTGGIYTNPAVIGIERTGDIAPSGFSLSQNYPNPFNPSTKIRFAIPKSSLVKIVVYDELGRELESIVNEQLNAGSYEAEWSADKYSSGTYYYKLIAGDFIETKKMTLVK